MYSHSFDKNIGGSQLGSGIPYNSNADLTTKVLLYSYTATLSNDFLSKETKG